MTDPRPVAGTVVLAPFANERLREWPWQYFHELIGFISRVHRLKVNVVGTRAQRAGANAIVRGHSSEFVFNTCGALSWEQIAAAIDDAPYVVANNSGIAHLAAARGRWTLCIFAASHPVREWAPRGPRVVTISRDVACSPCALGRDLCPNGVACMVDMFPDDVFWRFHEVWKLAGGGESSDDPARAAVGQRIQRSISP